MILDYVKFKNFPLTAEIPLFLVHGNPRNISNEIEWDIISFYRKLKKILKINRIAIKIYEFWKIFRAPAH